MPRGTIQQFFFGKSQPWFATREYHGTQPCHEDFSFIKTPSPSGRGGYKCLPPAQSSSSGKNPESRVQPRQSLIWLCRTQPNKNSISILPRPREGLFLKLLVKSSGRLFPSAYPGECTDNEWMVPRGSLTRPFCIWVPFLASAIPVCGAGVVTIFILINTYTNFHLR